MLVEKLSKEAVELGNNHEGLVTGIEVSQHSVFEYLKFIFLLLIRRIHCTVFLGKYSDS